MHGYIVRYISTLFCWLYQCVRSDVKSSFSSAKIEKLLEMVSIHWPSGYEPDTLPLRHRAVVLLNSFLSNIITYFIISLILTPTPIVLLHLCSILLHPSIGKNDWKWSIACGVTDDALKFPVLQEFESHWVQNLFYMQEDFLQLILFKLLSSTL